MKTLISRIALAASILFVATCAVAQPQRQQNQNNRAQQMAGTVVQAAIQNLAAQSDPLHLIVRKDVQKDLGLDLGQRNKIDNTYERQQRELQQARVQNRRNPTVVAELQQKQRVELQEKVDELLSKAQKLRLKEIALQLQGNSAVMSPEVQKQLETTSDQNERIKQIAAEKEAKIAQLQLNAGQGGLRPQDLASQIQQIQQETNAALSEVLSPEQQEKLKTLFGKPFKAG